MLLKFILNPNNQRLILSIICIILIMTIGALSRVVDDEKKETQRQIANIESLQDSVREYRTQNGKLGFEKLSLQTDLNQLKELNKDLYDELEEERGNVKIVTQTEYVVVAETVWVYNQIDFLDGVYQLTFSSESRNDGGYRKLGGYSTFRWDNDSNMPYDSKTIITDDVLSMKLSTGIREEEGKMTIFVKTDYPNVRFSSIEGAVLDSDFLNSEQKINKFGLGLHFGYGMSDIGLTPYLGVGLNYNIIQF